MTGTMADVIHVRNICMLRSALGVVLLVVLGGCSSRSTQDACNFSRFDPIEVPRAQMVDENTTYNRNTHWGIKPVYPPEARAKRLSGTVHLRALVDSGGRAIMTCPIYVAGESRPDKSLVDAAAANVRQWRFVPLAANSQVFRQTTVDLKFTLSDSPK